MPNNETATVYTLRVDVTVPHADGQPEYSATEIMNRVDAALFYVPGNCDVRVLEYTPEYKLGQQDVPKLARPLVIAAAYRALDGSLAAKAILDDEK